MFVNDRADRHIAKRHRIAGLHVEWIAGHDRIALRQPLCGAREYRPVAVMIFHHGR